MLKTSLFLVGLLASTSAYAQDAAERDHASAPDVAASVAKTDDSAIVVSATRTPIEIDRVAASVTVLDKDSIDRSQDIGVTELLLRTPGVSIARNGGYGTSTSLRIRGAESEQTVVVIDGIKLNDPSSTGGGYNFANLLTGDAARIEVLRGPQSILWGSQAIGGVVNIVTPLPDGPLEGSFDIEAGSRETVSARVAIGGKTGPLSFRLGGQAFTTDGISAIAPAFGGVEPDGYTNRSVSGRAVLEIAPGVSADLRGYFADGRVDIDAFNADSPEYSLNREFVGYAGINFDLLGGRFRNRAGYGYTNTDRENYNPARARAITFDAAGRNRRFEYQGSFAVARGWDLMIGAENEKSRFRSVSPAASLAMPIPAPAQGRAEITSFYGQLSGDLIEGLTLTGGVRNDDHSRYGSKTLFAAGGVYRAPWGTILRANYGEGFKAPSLFQLFSEYGNIALAPEQARGWEAGAEQQLMDGAVSVGATYFERDTTNQIAFNSCTTTSADPRCFVPGSTTTRRSGFYYNVSKAYAQGIEARASLRPVKNLLIDGNFTWAEAIDRTPGAATFNRFLARRPRHTANGSINYTFDQGGSIGAAVRWSGEAFDNAANTTRFAPYTLVDLRGDVPITSQLRIFARVENVFDEQYSTAFRYNSLGRSFYAGFRGRF
ncbi:TonB-dependent receptor [Sphingomonas sp. MG17]|uniref:TonB-dependent receptor n=1 Tax=Sphingomonas tagetis TaxID=2949092 RepID=A0A9X2HH41_9SPHN|nr:TonB-dependent receptor [Sphingomonas tagetis]MCP3729812.1 TonB-dependent receptor [Sphingomonas tagetis]